MDLEDLKSKWLAQQEQLQKQLVCTDACTPISDLKYIGGVDISFIKGNETDACAALVVLEYPSLKPVYQRYKMVKLTCPYISTFLAFREVDHLVTLVNQLKADQPELMPQIILVDGNGYLHPRRLGLATHLGLLLDIPTVGIGKNFLVLDGLEIKKVKEQTKITCPVKGEWMPLVGTSGTCWGASLSTNDNSANPLFVSIGHRISLETAVQLVKAVSLHRIPEPIRYADLGSREFLRNLKSDLSCPEGYQPEITL